MKRFVKAKTHFTLFALLTVILLSACSRPVTTAPSPVTPSDNVEATNPPNTISPRPPAALPTTRIEVTFFHMPARCSRCLCFEERTAHVVETYFQEELESGMLVFQICELGDRSKADLIRKYDAYGSQLFVNTIINNADNIKNIKEIWDWPCDSNKQGFDDKVRNVIEQALKEID